MPFALVRNDIAQVSAQALVAPANELLVIDGGAGYSVAQAVGFEQIQAAVAPLAPVETGSVVVTPVACMQHVARFVIHAVGPVWGQGDAAQVEMLCQVYERIFQQALELGVESVAVPLISTGARGCPAQVSFDAAFRTMQAFLQEHDTNLLITLVLFGENGVQAAQRYVPQVQQLINDAYVRECQEREFRRYASAQPMLQCDFAPEYTLSTAASSSSPSRFRETIGGLFGRPSRKERGKAVRLEETAFEETCLQQAPSFEDTFDKSALEQSLRHIDASFSDTLLELIAMKGMTDAQVYKRANVSRQHFSKIRSDANYQPTKKTVLAFCIALELSLEASEDLLARAGFAFSPSSRFDLIVRYYIEQNEYDIFAINAMLYEFDQPLLG